ncbi:sulfotransferase [Pseudohalioglobus sediminis]|uniref:Sulfotransferase n=1 Tax=Pseudohalioglobus sediminis TaxID=2606449 RepID=A0A5B0WMJ9_9GAMM|nr:sulfotransferase [Pseudohalioglobus sediminis]KAA1188202.1 sulfotransferase [Pseudohalioglobus sediminis]
MSEQATTFIADELIAEAVAQTGFEDFGEPPYRGGLEVLLETYDRHVLDPEGRRRCRERVVFQLATRLKCENAFQTIPQWQEQEITAPVFVTGLPRSGTSALLNLLVSAPENRGLLQWEVQFPDPWPGSQPGDKDPRYDFLAAALEESRNSEFAKIHFIDADTPEECVLLHAYAFTGVQLGFEIMLEPYHSWVLQQDAEPMYAYQKKQMQMLNWRNPGQQWMLKAPAHMHNLDAILKVFPDARFVWCHRDPQKVIPSINSMNKVVMDMYLGDHSHLDAGEIGRAVMEWYAMSLERGLALREQLPPEMFVDCSQQEFVDAPLDVVQRVYDAFGMTLADSSRAVLASHVRDNPKGKHGRHEYNLEEYGLTRELIADRFAFYTQDGRWPISS